MTTLKTTTYEQYEVGDVLTYKSYSGKLRALKILERPLIESTQMYRFVGVWGFVKDNEFVPDEGNPLEIRSTKNLRDMFTHRWTADVKQVRVPVKGNAYKDDEGNYYLAESDTKVWSLKEGTWTTVKDLDDASEWGTYDTTRRIVLHDVTTIIGDPYSKQIG